MNVIDLPGSLDQTTVDDVLDQVATVEGPKILVDGRHLRWVGPDGMVGLLAAGAVLGEGHEERPRFRIPEQSEVTGYLARMGFFRAAEELYHFDRSPPRRPEGASEVLLEVTSIAENADVHEVVNRVQGRAGAILSKTLHYPPTAAVPFSVILSEICQNIVEHAGARGWVAAQSYNWKKRLGRQVVVIAVGDVGRGFRGSLSSEHAPRFGDRWSDATALEAAFMHGLTRFPDSGRGQGIQQIRKQVRRWDGSISIRSGTARIADVPEWDDAPPIRTGMEAFPGAHISIVLPAREEA